jgi:hypothetical protein
VEGLYEEVQIEEGTKINRLERKRDTRSHYAKEFEEHRSVITKRRNILS